MVALECFIVLLHKLMFQWDWTCTCCCSWSTFAYGVAKATMARDLRLGLMEEVRDMCDKLEGTLPASAWTLATYRELLFLDATHGAKLV